MELTKEWLKKHCKENDLYRTPYLNDKLYLHFKGFTRIQNLEEYTGLKSLFLEGNALESLNGLQHLKELRCLYAQQNTIDKIDHLNEMEHLYTLNLSNNCLSKLEGLSNCRTLNTLQVAQNRLETVDSICHLAECPSIMVLDISKNKLADGEGVLKVLGAMPNLSVLYMTGNPLCSSLPHYRKTLVACLPHLKYLDDRPIFDPERRCSEAWARGGIEEERKERVRLKEAEKERDERNFQAMRRWRTESLAKRRELMGLPALASEDESRSDDNSDDKDLEAEEPPELISARERLAQFPPRDGEEEPNELTQARAKAQAANVARHVPTSSHADVSDAPPRTALAEIDENRSFPLTTPATKRSTHEPSEAIPEQRPSEDYAGVTANSMAEDSDNDEMPPLETVDFETERSFMTADERLEIVDNRGEDTSGGLLKAGLGAAGLALGTHEGSKHEPGKDEERGESKAHSPTLSEKVIEEDLRDVEDADFLVEGLEKDDGELLEGCGVDVAGQNLESGMVKGAGEGVVDIAAEGVSESGVLEEETLFNVGGTMEVEIVISEDVGFPSGGSVKACSQVEGGVAASRSGEDDGEGEGRGAEAVFECAGEIVGGGAGGGEERGSAVGKVVESRAEVEGARGGTMPGGVDMAGESKNKVAVSLSPPSPPSNMAILSGTPPASMASEDFLGTMD